jgi:hypothetical protein
MIVQRSLTTTAADGTTVRALDEGLIIHPGMETGARYQKLAAIRARRFWVLRLHRRQYRLDMKKDARLGDPCTVAQEVEHVLALVELIDGPLLVYGHSCGAPRRGPRRRR